MLRMATGSAEKALSRYHQTNEGKGHLYLSNPFRESWDTGYMLACNNKSKLKDWTSLRKEDEGKNPHILAF